VEPLVRGEAVRILHDAESRLWVVALANRTHAFQEGSLAPVPLRAASMRSELSASPFTVGAAAIGVLLSMLGLARARSHLRRADAFAAMRQGTLAPDGWVQLEDGSPELRVEMGKPLQPGPVIAPVSAGDGDGAAAYRGAPVLSGGVVAGRKEELVLGAAFAAAASLAASIAALSLTAAPLLAALIAGLAL
jgi:hypothetical protein